MKSRNREINIFNMSLLDILCGALGAFCFLTLSLLPYYGKNAGQEGQKTQQELTDTRKELEKLKAEMSKNEPADVNKLRQEADDLRKQLEAEKQKSDASKSAIAPVLMVSVEWGAPQSKYLIALDHPDPQVQKRLKVTKLDDRTVLLFPDVVPGEYQLYFVPDMKVISANETLQSILCDKVSCISLPPINVKAFDKPDRIPAGKITIRDGEAHYKKP